MVSEGRNRMHRAFALLLVIFFTGIVAFSQQAPQQNTPAAAASPAASASRAQAMQSLDESSNSLQQLLQIHQKMVQMNEEQAKIYSALSKKVDDLSKLAAQKGTSQADLLQATKNLQETQMSFNLQYLQLQNSMQNENRQFTMVSNIMKTKHDTVKNSISNIR
jgi:hypothetical protein